MECKDKELPKYFGQARLDENNGIVDFAICESTDALDRHHDAINEIPSEAACVIRFTGDE